MHRTQIYLPDEQTQRLDARAGAEGISRSVLIRRAIDDYLARQGTDTLTWRSEWQAALTETAGIAPHLQGGADYVEEMREVDAKRLGELRR